MTNFLTRIGKAEGFAVIGLVMFAALCALLATGILVGEQFVTAFGILVASFFGGGAVASFRDR